MLNIKEYRNKLPVQNLNNNDYINSRDLYRELDVKRDYSDWIKHKIKKYNFKENTDFIIINNNESVLSEGGRPKKDYLLTINICIFLTHRIGTGNYNNILEYLNYITHNNKEIIIKEPSKLKRKEYIFSEMLEKITGMSWKKQYPIDGSKFRLDFKLDNKLIVEYDECFHKYNKEQDEYRIKYCQQWLAKNETRGFIIPVIRVKEEEELEGLHKIINYLINIGEFNNMRR